MTIRTGAVAGGLILAAALAGVATSQPPPPSPVAAAQVDLPRSRVDNAALATARQAPLGARLRGVLGQEPAAVRFLALVDGSPVPVLAPADPALLRTAHIYTGDRHYMLTVQRGTQLIEVYGASKAFRSPVPPAATAPVQTPGATAGPRVLGARLPAQAARAAAQARAAGLANVRTERTEYGVDVGFSRFGAAYNVSFLCEGPEAAGCAEADALAFAASLQLIGGGAS
ncbi:MAG: hypothetical protein ACK4VY_01865 [Brevundimonas sp.]